MRFALIDAKKAEIPIETACTVLGVSISGYYAWKGRPASARQSDDMVMLAYIRAKFVTSYETYGSPRMHAELKELGLSIGRCPFRSIRPAIPVTSGHVSGSAVGLGG